MHQFNLLIAELNPICHLLTLLGAHHILHVSRARINTQGCQGEREHRLTMKMKALLFFETLITIYQSTRRQVPENLQINRHRSKQLRAGKACWRNRVVGVCIGGRKDDDNNNNNNNNNNNKYKLTERFPTTNQTL